MPMGLLAQEDTLNPIFSAFEGVVYQLPKDRLKEGYHPYVLELPVYDTIHWESINFPGGEVDEVTFPGVDLQQAFGIIFRGTVTIPKAGWYRFATKSDDGSVLWIDRKRVVGNDRDHRMQLRMDTVVLRAGEYPVRLWYYQAYPTRYGIQMAGEYYRDLRPDEALPEREEIVVLNSQQLQFAHNSSELPDTAALVLQPIVEKLQGKSIKQIEITGHTDNVGTVDYNQRLSLQRAVAVRKALTGYLQNSTLSFAVSGKGASQPIADNDSEAGRAQNRRVEIRIIY